MDLEKKVTLEELDAMMKQEGFTRPKDDGFIYLGNDGVVSDDLIGGCYSEIRLIRYTFLTDESLKEVENKVEFLPEYVIYVKD